MRNQNHGLWMIIGCVLPLLLVFLLPVFGVKSNNSFLVLVLAMFACHFLMMGGHGRGDDNEDENKKDEDHEGHEKRKEHQGHMGCH